MNTVEDELLERWCDIAWDEERAASFRARLQRRMRRVEPRVSQAPRRTRHARPSRRPVAWVVPGAVLVATVLILALIGLRPEEDDGGAGESPAVTVDATSSAEPASTAENVPVWLGRRWQSDAGRLTIEPSGIGSVVLAAGSRLLAPDSTTAVWRLEAGRAEFALEAQPTARPFRLQVAGAEILVLGTRFTVAVDEELVQLHEGRLRVTRADGGQRVLLPGDNSRLDRHRTGDEALLAHWPLDGGLAFGPQPALRGRGGVDPGSLCLSDRGLQPGQLLLSDVAGLATDGSFTVSCRYRPTAGLGQEAKSLLRRMDLGSEPGRGFYLSGRPLGEEWRLAATLRLRDGTFRQLLLSDPWAKGGEKEVALRLAYDGEQWRCWLAGALVASERVSAAFLPAGEAPFAIGPAPGWIRDVWVWRGAVAP